MDKMEVGQIDEYRAAVLLGLSLPDLRWFSRLLGLGHSRKIWRYDADCLHLRRIEAIIVRRCRIGKIACLLRPWLVSPDHPGGGSSLLFFSTLYSTTCPRTLHPLGRGMK